MLYLHCVRVTPDRFIYSVLDDIKHTYLLDPNQLKVVHDIHRATN